MNRTVENAQERLEEQGFMLVGLIVAIFLILLMLSVAAPKVAQDLRRDREVEAVHRGNQYVRAIQLYYKKFGHYPGSIEQLEKTNNIRFLRQKYGDPLTGKPDWRLIKVGEAKTTVKGFFGQPLAGLPTAGMGGAAGSSPGIGSPVGSGSSAFGSGAGGVGGSGSAFGSGAGSSFWWVGFGWECGGFRGYFRGFGCFVGGGWRWVGVWGFEYCGRFGEFGVFWVFRIFGWDWESVGYYVLGGGAPFVGVGSSRGGDSILVVNEQTTYPTWEFLYDPRSDLWTATVRMLGGGVGSAPATTGRGSGFGSGGIGGATPNTPTSGSGTGTGLGTGTTSPGGSTPMPTTPTPPQ